MGIRFSMRCLIAAAGLVALSAPGLTQVGDPPGPPGPPGPPAIEPIQPPKDLPRAQRGDRTRNLEFLFEALKVAPDDTSAKHIEERIWALWVVSNSDTTNLLMTRVKTAVEAQDLDLAIKLLDTVIELKPDYIEGWNRRATLYYMKKDFSRSLADIRQVLTREPRHFGALSGLGLILQEFGDDKRALDAFRKALEIYPRLQKIPDAVKSLSDKLEGRDI